ncbi:MAG: putative V-type proton ATPase 116 kDa subunit a, partial [Streblomastix strix]
MDKNSNQEKHVFVTFFSGEHTQKRITKLCESFNASIYPFPESPVERQEALNQIDERLKTLDAVQIKSEEQQKQILKNLEQNLCQWSAFVVKEKAIFHTLNMFSSDRTSNCRVGEGWVPSRSMGEVHAALSKASRSAKASVPAIAQIMRGGKKKGE